MPSFTSVCKGVSLVLASAVLWHCDFSKNIHEPIPGEKHACLHAAKPKPAMASINFASAPLVGFLHVYYRIGLPSGKESWVRIEIEETGKYSLYLHATFPWTLLDSGGAPQTPLTHTRNLKACVRIKEVHQFSLDEGTYYLRIDPTSMPEIGMLLEESD